MEQKNNNDNLLKILQKENEVLKNLNKNKLTVNETCSSLLTVLEMQRHIIKLLEEGKFFIYK